MRQVDQDELTYQIFSGLRRWTPSVRKRVFAPPHKRHPFAWGAAADGICGSLRTWDFIDPADPQTPLSLDQISNLFEAAIADFPGAVARLWLSGQRDREREAHAATAIFLAQSLDHLEVLSDTEIVHLGVQRLYFPQIEAPAHAFAAHWP